MAIQDEIYSYFESGSITFILIGILIVLYLIEYHRKYSGFPPGPWGLPLFGYLYFFTNKPYEDFVQMTKKYGDVFSIKIGSRSVIVLNHFDAIKEAFVKQGNFYAGKPDDWLVGLFGDHKSLFVSDADSAKDQRKFLIKSLKDFGFGKQGIEERIQEEAQIATAELFSMTNQPYDVGDIMLRSVANILSCLVFNKRFEYEDKEAFKSIKYMPEIMAKSSHFTALDAFPLIQSIIPEYLSGFKRYKELTAGIYSFVDKQIELHRKTFDENNIRDVLDVYLMKGKQIVENGDKVEGTIYKDDYMRANALSMFGAGMDTTTAVLLWSLKLMALHPEVQEKLQKEIDDVIGRERLPSMSDRSKMPFMEATLLELERFITHIPLTFYHKVTDDTVLRDFRIPKDTLVLANLWSVHYDHRLWKDPYEFQPERFLQNNQDSSKLKDYVIAHSIGKRSCIGQSLSKMIQFIFLTALLQAFTFHTTSEDNSLKTLTEMPTRKLLSSCLCIKPRGKCA